MARILLGELLVRAGVIQERSLDAALREQQRSAEKLGKILLSQGALSEEPLYRGLSKQLKVPLAVLDDADIPRDLLLRFDADFARAQRVCPERIDNRQGLVVAMEDPSNVMLLDEIARRVGRRVQPSIASERAILAAVERRYAAAGAYLGTDLFDAESSDAEMYRVSEHSEPIAAPLPSSSAEGARPTPAPKPTSVPPPDVHPTQDADVLELLKSTQIRQLKAIRAMVDLLVEKRYFSRNEYLERLNRR